MKSFSRVVLIDVENTVFEFPDLPTAIRACLPAERPNLFNWRAYARMRLYETLEQARIRVYDDYGDQINPGLVLAEARRQFAPKSKRLTPFRAGPVPHTGRCSSGHMFRPVATTNERRANKAFANDMIELGLDVDKIGRRRKLPTNCDDLNHHHERGWKNHRGYQWKPA